MFSIPSRKKQVCNRRTVRTALSSTTTATGGQSRVTWKLSMGVEGIRRNFEEVEGRRRNYFDGSVAQGGTRRNYADESVPPSCNHEFETVLTLGSVQNL